MTRLLAASLLAAAAATLPQEGCPEPSAQLGGASTTTFRQEVAPAPPSQRYALVDDGARLTTYQVDPLTPALTVVAEASHRASYLPVWPVDNPALGLVHLAIAESGPSTGHPDTQLLATYRMETEGHGLAAGEVRKLGETKNQEVPLAVHTAGLLFVLGGGERSIRSYAITGAALTQVATTPVPVEVPGSLLADPSGSYLLASYQSLSGSQLDTYRIDPASRQLTLQHRLSLTQPLDRMAFDTSGRLLLGLGRRDNSLRTYSFDAATGSLAAQQRLAAGRWPADLAQVGRRIYVTAPNSDEILGFEQDPESGMLTELGAMMRLDEPLSLAVHPTGRFLYLGRGRWTHKAIEAFAVDPSTGDLTPLGVVASGNVIRIGTPPRR